MPGPKSTILDIVPADLKGSVLDVSSTVREFISVFHPLESESLYVLVDPCKNTRYCECHLRAEKLVPLATIDVPLDPDEQPEYRANREIVENHAAYERMKRDARQRRTFSNIVAEFTVSFDPDHPLKIIGGQHRFNAIKEAFEQGINEYHGLKVYFGLDADQRLDVQLISNTAIAVSTDLFDRMQETLMGPQLRDWCQEVGLLETGRDFADRRQRGDPITVRAARTFILNYFNGKQINVTAFEETATTPIVCKSGVPDPSWDELKLRHQKLWQDTKLQEAGREFALLVQAQRDAIEKTNPGGRSNVDFAEKALNFAILPAWAFIAGMLHANTTRLKRHFELRTQAGRDPLNAAELARGRHKSDPDNYRGLGYRTDPRERGRFVELFFLQAEKGGGITKGLIDLAMKKYHAKQALLEVRRAEEADRQNEDA